MENGKLFTEFPPVDTRTWKEKILKDLKGADYEKKLVWKTDEGFTVEPFYRSEDTVSIPFSKTLPGKFPFLRGKNPEGNRWYINEFIQVKNIAESNLTAVKAVEKGAESITFSFSGNREPDADDVKNLLKDIDIQKIPVHFISAHPLAVMNALSEKHKQVKGSVLCDPLNRLSLRGGFMKSEEDDLGTLSRMLTLSQDYPDIKTIGIDATLFYESGARITTSMALGLSVAVDYVDFLTEKGFSPEEIFPRMLFRFAVGSDYFMEIAKFRALRYLWAKIAESYGITGKKAAMTVHAVTGLRNKTVYDPYVNMLRTTTETMAAILGGADEITTLQFDVLHPLRPELGKRIARNQQLILRLESYLDKVSDIPAGSYYIENLTKKLIDKAWQLFLEMEEQGGYLKAFKEGVITKKVEEEAAAADREIAFRKKNILGVNQFPNLTESVEQPLPGELFHKKIPSGTLYKPLVPYRQAAAFEALRYQTDRYALKAKRPVVWMFTYGDLAMRRARAQFAGNFFGCAGYQIIDNNGFETVEEGIEAARRARPDVVVLCSSDPEYRELALPVFDALKEETLVVMAGKPQPLAGELTAKGFSHFIHAGMNVLESLRNFQKLLHIENK